MKIHASNPSRAACAATALAKLPVEEQLTTLNPKRRAAASATATTRSLNDSVGKQTASFLTYKFLAPSAWLRWRASTRGVNPVGSVLWKPSARGRSAL